MDDEAEREKREQAVKRQAVEQGLKLTKSGDDYALLTETDAPLAYCALSEIEAELAKRSQGAR